MCLVTAGALVGAHRNADPVGLWIFVAVIGGWIVTLCLHEFMHAVLALAGGDTSVRARGYLTLNPFRYTNAANSVIIPLILLAVGGIPLPGGAVLIEPGRLRRRWWSSVVSAGGPLTNLVAGLVLARVGASFFTGLGEAISYLALLQCATAILNLLPVPGFDGFGIIAPYLPQRFLMTIAPYRQWLPLVVFALLWFTPGGSAWLFDWAQRLFDAAGGDQVLAWAGSAAFRFWE